ncbi:MAG: GNAT family N-acetyltransferase [Candidatus Thorarchaeota archaeon]
MTTPPTLTSQRVTLQPLTASDMPYFVKWYSDPEMLRLSGEVEPWTEDKFAQWYQNLCTDANKVWFTIVVNETQRVIGNAGLLRMFTPWKTTDMSVEIGEKALWGHGYGTEAGRRLLQYVFDELKFHRVAIYVMRFNTRALRFWTELGFQHEGIARQSYYYNSQYSDFIMMSILEDEYRQKYGSLFNTVL